MSLMSTMYFIDPTSHSDTMDHRRPENDDRRIATRETTARRNRRPLEDRRADGRGL